MRRVLTAGPYGDPGTFAYSDIGPHLLSAVLAQASTHVDTGIRAARAAGPARDQQPATIEGPISDVDKPDVVNTNSFRWLRDPDGVHAGPFGLALTRGTRSKSARSGSTVVCGTVGASSTPTTAPRCLHQSGPRARWQDRWLRVSLVVHTAGDARLLQCGRACTGS